MHETDRRTAVDADPLLFRDALYIQIRSITDCKLLKRTRGKIVNVDTAGLLQQRKLQRVSGIADHDTAKFGYFLFNSANILHDSSVIVRRMSPGMQ